MDYRYTQTDYAKTILEHGFVSDTHRPTELCLLATYMRRNLGYPPKKVREELYLWCESHIPGFEKERYYKMIHSAIQKACRKDSVLINIPWIDFFQYELDYIDHLKIFRDADTQIPSPYEHHCKKLLFTLLFQMKINRCAVQIRNPDREFTCEGKFFQGSQKNYSALKKQAKLSGKIKLHEELIHTLWKNGLVTPMPNGLLKLDFIEPLLQLNVDSHRDPINSVLRITDYESVGWYYDLYHQDKKISFCKGCGRLFRKKSNCQVYCSDLCFSDNRRTYKAAKQKEYRNSTDVDNSKIEKSVEK